MQNIVREYEKLRKTCLGVTETLQCPYCRQYRQKMNQTMYGHWEHQDYWSQMYKKSVRVDGLR